MDAREASSTHAMPSSPSLPDDSQGFGVDVNESNSITTHFQLIIQGIKMSCIDL
ncbi:MAG: hypothetical protein IPL92_13010 [Saprospiraceae bacterium]|nr:hypothetical protein [Candidatus Opimibacter iunctus]